MGVPENQFGTQPAKDGNAYVGVYAFLRSHEAREYIQIELTEPLYHRIPYAVGFHVSIAEKSHYAVSTLGAYLSVDPIESDDYLTFDVTPQILPSSQQPMMDTTVWVLITDTIVSQDGGERYLTIGNFSSDAETDTVLFNPQPNNWQLSYYYIDDVSVIALDSVPNGISPPSLQSGWTCNKKLDKKLRLTLPYFGFVKSNNIQLVSCNSKMSAFYGYYTRFQCIQKQTVPLV